MKKVLLVIAIIICILLSIAGFLYWKVTSSPTVEAQLLYGNGQVLVNNVAVTGDVKLNAKDMIETKSAAKASVVLFESVVITLNPDTKITLSDITKEHPQIEQQKGSTWNKFLKLTGVESYSIKTGDSVASVRGTLFSFENGKVVTAEGIVGVEALGGSMDVRALQVCEWLNGTLHVRDATLDEMIQIKDMLVDAIKNIKELRVLEMEKKKAEMDIIGRHSGTDRNQMIKIMEDLDTKGPSDVDALVSQSPIESASLVKMAGWTKEIQKMNVLITTVDEKTSLNQSTNVTID